MATVAIASPCATKTVAVAATCSKITFDDTMQGKLSGLYLYCPTECRYQIVEASSLADGAAAPASDYMVIPAATLVPVPISLVEEYDNALVVWCPGGSDTMSIAPYPVTR